MKSDNRWFKELHPMLKGLIIAGIILDLAFYALAGGAAGSTWSRIQRLAKPARAVLTPSTPKKVAQPEKQVTRKSDADDRPETVMVLRVIDGDTIEIEGGRRVRYIGIDCPEDGKEYSAEATARNRKLVEGRVVTLVKDVSEKDVFGRLLRYVYVGDVFVNARLVEESLAEAVPYPPDTAYEDEFKELENKAKDEGKGIWVSLAQEDESQGAIPQDLQQGQQVTVYINEPGIEYHVAGCKRAGPGSKAVSLNVAKANGFMPCDLCDPPQ